jgi:farnesyl diphosphate synthase
MKTSALIRFACEASAILGPRRAGQRRALSGERLGAAFQIADDLLDTHGNAALMGKAARKDAGKATLVSVLGRKRLGYDLRLWKGMRLPPSTVRAARRDLRDAARFVVTRQM